MYWIREITVNRNALTLSGTETAVFVPVVKVLSSNSLDRRIPTDTPVITFLIPLACTCTLAVSKRHA